MSENPALLHASSLAGLRAGTGAALCTMMLLGAAASVLVACHPKSAQQTAVTTNAASSEASGQSPASASLVAPPAVTQASWSPDTLEQLVAPIALYPDQLVGQILAASVNFQEVLDAGNWLLQNQSLTGDALDQATQKAGFGPPMQALVQFPTVVDMMCQQPDWTHQLGSAFSSDQQAVLDAVQRLRAQAQQVGNLQSTPQQKVETRTEEQKTVIEVKPADPQVVYVPQYDPQVIYTTPPPAPSPPPPAPATPESTSGTVSTGAAVAGGLLAFGVGVLVGNAVHSDEYCYPHWGAGAVYVGPRPFYPPAYAYRPAYSPAFRPAYGYAPPANYRYAYNRNVNVVNVNNNYFNQFNHNRNLSGAAPNTPSWKGQTTYAGARNVAQAERNVARNEQNVARAQSNTARAQRDIGESQRNVTQAQRNVQTTQGRVAQNQRNVATTQENAARTQRQSQVQQNLPHRNPGQAAQVDRAQSQDRGYGRSTAAATPAATSAPAQDHAFSGLSSSDSGEFARASSARGHASAGGLMTASEHGGRARR